MTQTKVAWIRDPGGRIGHPWPGRLNCKCGKAPTSLFNKSQGYVACVCGVIYTWDGYVVNTTPEHCYALRVAYYEAQGMTTSDAQGVVDAEDRT